jgi:O-antigen/teichoic acid export membrane protein
VLIFGYAAYTVYITLVTTLLAENRPGRALAIPVTMLPVAAGLIWVGVTWLGALGAAFASLFSVASVMVVVIGYIFRRFRPTVDGRSLARIVLASAVVGGLAWLWAPSGLMLIVSYGSLGGLYLILLLALGEVKFQDISQTKRRLLHRRGD